MEDSLAENDDSYIEIELDSSSSSSSSCALVVVPTSTCVSSKEEDDKVIDHDDDLKVKRQESEEYDELRISISSTIALPCDDVINNNDQRCVVVVDDPSSENNKKSEMKMSVVDVDLSSSPQQPRPPPFLRLTDHSAGSDPSLVLTHQSHDDDHQQQRRAKLSSDNNCNVDFSWENPSSDHNTTTSHVTLQTTMPFNSTNDNMEHHSTPRHNRVKEGSIRRRNGGMIMKMLIKFKGMKLSTLISSLIKPPSCQDHNNNKGHSTRKYCRTILQCYHQKNMVVNPSSGPSQEDYRSSKRSVEETTTARRLSKLYWDLNNNNNNISNSNEGSFRSSRRSSWNRSVVEIDLGALKGMFSAVAQKGNSSNKRKSSSTISSCDNSPIHEGFSFTCTADNSIQAAIAYCKTSFGQTSDFSFS